MRKNMKKFGFTMAEVLITLGIIGVVAAMTLPSLISKYNEALIINNLKQTYAELNQVVKMSEVDHGEISDWTMPQKREEGSTFAEEYILPYMQNVSRCDNKDKCFNNNMIKYPDGSDIGITYRLSPKYKYKGKSIVFAPTYYKQAIGNPCSGSGAIQMVEMLVDVDGNRGFSILGKDVFLFTIYNYSKKCPWSIGSGDYYGLHLGGEYGNYAYYQYPPEQVIKECQNKNYKVCGLAIQKNNWKIPKNYPIKF